MSLKPEDVDGFRSIIDILLEKYDDLGSVRQDNLEPHERKALEMFREFEKHGDFRKSGRSIPVIG